MSYDAEVLADAPLHYWEFEDAGLTTCAPTVGSLSLDVPAGNTHADGMQGGQAIECQNSNVDYGPGTSTVVSALGENATIELWSLFHGTDPTGNEQSGPAFSCNGNGQFNLFTPYDGGGIAAQRHQFGGGGFDDEINPGGTPPAIDVWHHAVATYDGADIILYFEGVEIGRRASTGVLIPDDGFYLNGDQSETGKVRFTRLAIYDHALTPERIAAHYNAGIAPAGLSLRDVPATTLFRPKRLVGLSEGLAASTYSNYGQARRRVADGTFRPLWRNYCGSMEHLVDKPGGSELWYDDRDIAFLREDVKDAAEIMFVQAQSIRQLVDTGFDPMSVVKAIDTGDLLRLKHDGIYRSVQVQLDPAKASTDGTPLALPSPTEKPALPAPAAKKPAAAAASGVAALTARERSIADRCARNLTNKEIAAELALSEKTVENHITNVLGKLGVHSRTEIADALLVVA